MGTIDFLRSTSLSCMFVHLGSNRSSKSMLEIILISVFAFCSISKESRESMEPYIKNTLMSVQNSKHFAFVVLVHLFVSDHVFQCLMFYVTTILCFFCKRSI